MTPEGANELDLPFSYGTNLQVGGRPSGDEPQPAHLPCGVIAVDGDGCVTLVNPCAASLWPALSSVIGSLPPTPPGGGWRIDAGSLLARALRGEEPAASEIALDAPGAAETRRVQVEVAPLRQQDGRIVGAIAVCAVLPDVGLGSSRTAAAQGWTNQELQRSNSELLQFASVASHDLQEPLRKILAFGDRLRRSDGEALSARGQDSLDRMLAAAGRMQALINDLLTFARITTAPHPFVSVDLAAIASAVLEDLETQIARSGGRVTVGPLPTIEADPLQMRQLLQNLISNALKFQQADRPPEVTISAEIIDTPSQALPDAAPWHVLRVQDNGIGFEQQYAERIFRVFERLHGRTTYEGTGIGLALCAQIVARHGGGIRAEGMSGEGATFLLTLPTHHAKVGVV